MLFTTSSALRGEVDRQVSALFPAGVAVAFAELEDSTLGVYVPGGVQCSARWISYRRPSALRGERWARVAIAAAVHAEEKRLEHEHHRAIILGEMTARERAKGLAEQRTVWVAPAQRPEREEGPLPAGTAREAVAQYRLGEIRSDTTPASNLRVARAVDVSSTTVSHVDRDARRLVEAGECATLELACERISVEAAIPCRRVTARCRMAP